MGARAVKMIWTHSKKANIIPTTIMFFLALCVLAIILSPLTFFIGVGVNATNGTANGSLIAVIFNFYPLFLLLMFILAYAASIAKGG